MNTNLVPAPRSLAFALMFILTAVGCPAMPSGEGEGEGEEEGELVGDGCSAYSVESDCSCDADEDCTHGAECEQMHNIEEPTGEYRCFKPCDSDEECAANEVCNLGQVADFDEHRCY